MATAIVPGSFDPPTLGHVDLIRRAASCFETVVVAVGVNPEKRGMFTWDERAEMLRDALPGLEVIQFEGPLVRAAEEVGAHCIVKGVRDGTDLAYEQKQAAVNAELSGIETLLLPTAPRWGHVSSSMVKELHSLGLDPGPYVPQLASEILARRGRDA